MVLSKQKPVRVIKPISLREKMNMKKILYIALLAVLLVLGGYGCVGTMPAETEEAPAETAPVTPEETQTEPTLPVETAQPDLKNITFVLSKKEVTLVDGFSEVEAATGSASKITTRYFGNEAFGDLNGDGKDDAAFLITQDNGGSGTFFYVVAALRTETGYEGTNAVLLGDRIAPQTTELRDGMLIVNYADRNPDESFTTSPSVGVSKYLLVVNNELIEVDTPAQSTP